MSLLFSDLEISLQLSLLALGDRPIIRNLFFPHCFNVLKCPFFVTGSIGLFLSKSLERDLTTVLSSISSEAAAFDVSLR